jgi:hypothetical protein
MGDLFVIDAEADGSDNMRVITVNFASFACLSNKLAFIRTRL